MIQGSEQWKLARCGRITGSRFKAVLDVNKRTGQPNAARRKLVQTLRDERRTGVPEHVEPNEYMAHGTAMEPLAKAAYEFLNDCAVEDAGLIVHPTLDYIAYSPDGLVGADGLIEIKSPALEHRHTRTVESGKCPDDYIAQVQGGLWVTGRQWCDFISYYPSVSVEVVRVYRDEKFIERLAAECAAVWSEVIAQQTEAA